MTISLGIKSSSIMVAIALAMGCGDDDGLFDDDDDDDGDVIQEEAYQRVDLVTNATDPALINPWGIATSEQGFWIANEGTGILSVYDRNGRPVGGFTATPIDLGDGITGVVRNPSGDFVIRGNGRTARAEFIAARLDGRLVAWTDQIGSPGVVAVAANQGAVYTGLTYAMGRAGSQLYAANFSEGTIDVYNARFLPATVEGRFFDPNLPANYSPFNVQALADGAIYVTYAIPSEEGDEEVGAGLGVVNKFDTEGRLLARIATGGLLNAPWGLALAPDDFGPLSNTLLVGNFGDGRITGYSPEGRVIGQLEMPDGGPVVIDGLWAITFGDDANAGRSNVLYFAAGPNEEQAGAFGRLEVTTTNLASDDDQDDDDGSIY